MGLSSAVLVAGKATAERISDRLVARLVKKVAGAAGVRGDLPEKDRALAFSGHSLRSGLASSAEVDERYVQKQLGHSTAEMTRRYQRRRRAISRKLDQSRRPLKREAQPLARICVRISGARSVEKRVRIC